MRRLNNILNSGESFDMWKQSILLCYVGSKAHGTYMPNSNPNSIDDIDVMGIVMPTKEYFFGVKEFAQFTKFVDEWDVVIYGFHKMIRLLAKCNPNVLQVLFTPESNILKKEWVYDELRNNRDLFLSKNLIRNAFCGYANGQLHKMENMAYEGYMGQKRKALVDKYGYDTKNAQHLIRLLRQGIELLETGEMEVFRQDAAQLKQIKKGEWGIEKVKKEATKLFKKMEDAYSKSKLPENNNYDKINNFTVSLAHGYYVPMDH